MRWILTLAMVCALYSECLVPSAGAATLEENTWLASMAILGSRFCKNANWGKVQYIVAGAVADAERLGISSSGFKSKVSQRVAELEEWFKKTETACSELRFLLR